MSEDDARALLLVKMQPFATKRKNSIGLRGWCRKYGINPAHASEWLSGKRSPEPKILDALKLEWRIVRKARGAKP